MNQHERGNLNGAEKGKSKQTALYGLGNGSCSAKIATDFRNKNVDGT